MTRAALLLALAALAVMGTVPAGAMSLYQMNGVGPITITGTGLPACAPVVLVGDCTNAGGESTPTNGVAFSWGDLTVQGLGRLQNLDVAGQYSCKSEVPNVFESRIRGNTSNFELTFNFQCTRATGNGPTAIDGWFSNITRAASGAFKSVASHPHPVPTGPGQFVFKGFFKAGGSHVDPDSINAGNGDGMTCNGGFAPTGFEGAKIKSVAFAGQCTALEA